MYSMYSNGKVDQIIDDQNRIEQTIIEQNVIVQNIMEKDKK